MIEDVEKPHNLKVHIRGNPENLGEEAPRAFLSILCDGPSKPFSKGSGRMELAEAIVNPHNPLTARVMVNRIWAHHFGEGIVRTPTALDKLANAQPIPSYLTISPRALLKVVGRLKQSIEKSCYLQLMH